MIQKPYQISIQSQTIDANSPYEVRWNVSGSVQVALSIDIIDNSDNSPAWNLPKTNSYALKYTIPSGVLVNGKEYKFRVTVWNDANESASSDYVIFQTSSKPIVYLSPIGTVGSPTFVFSAQYEQGENVPLRSWIGIVYDSDKVQISSTGIRTSTPIEYEVKNLKSETNYYIEFQVTSNKGQTSTTGLFPFYVLYTRPQVNVNLTAENVPEVGGIKLQWDVAQVIGKSTCNDLHYINGEMVDLRNGCSVVFDEGFSVANDFTLKIWIDDPYKLTQGATGESYIIVSATPPSDLSAIWIYDPNQETEKVIGVIASNQQPINLNNLWIDDPKRTTEKELTVYVGEDKPSSSSLWIDTDTPEQEQRDYYLLKLFGENGIYKLWFEKDRFQVIKDIEGIISHYASPVVSGTRFFIALQQKGDLLDIVCESY